MTSLGLDVETSCAGARAGLQRPQPQEAYPVVAPDDFDMQSLAAHEVPFVTRGFEDMARLGRLLEASLIDLQKSAGGATKENAITQFYLSVPDPERMASGGSLQNEAGGDEEFTPTAASAEEMAILKSELSDWVIRVAHNAGWPGAVALRFVTVAGHAGIAEAIMSAAQDMTQRGENAYAVVAGVDSLLDTSTLAWLHACGRLKEPSLAAGVPAGEAGVAIWIERGTSNRLQKPWASLDAVAVGQESSTLLSGGHSTGRALADVIAAVEPVARDAKSLQPWVITDHNGELYRAVEWAYAVLILERLFPAIINAHVWSPASCFGDTGCASAGVALATACRAFERRYAPSSHAIVVSSSEDVVRGAILVSKYA